MASVTLVELFTMFIHVFWFSFGVVSRLVVSTSLPHVRPLFGLRMCVLEGARLFPSVQSNVCIPEKPDCPLENPPCVTAECVLQGALTRRILTGAADWNFSPSIKTVSAILSLPSLKL
jgi:hypothetical protein